MRTQDIVNRMADVMANRAASAGSCTEEDLAKAGFTRAEMDRHGDAARAKARDRAALDLARDFAS